MLGVSEERLSSTGSCSFSISSTTWYALTSPLPYPIVSSLPSVLTPVFLVPVLIRSLSFRPLVAPPFLRFLPYVLLLLRGR